MKNQEFEKCHVRDFGYLDVRPEMGATSTAAYRWEAQVHREEGWNLALRESEKPQTDATCQHEPKHPMWALTTFYQPYLDENLPACSICAELAPARAVNAAEEATEKDCLKVVQRAYYEAERRRDRAAMHVAAEIEKYMKEIKLGHLEAALTAYAEEMREKCAKDCEERHERCTAGQTTHAYCHQRDADAIRLLPLPNAQALERHDAEVGRKARIDEAERCMDSVWMLFVNDEGTYMARDVAKKIKTLADSWERLRELEGGKG